MYACMCMRLRVSCPRVRGSPVVRVYDLYSQIEIDPHQ